MTGCTTLSVLFISLAIGQSDATSSADAAAVREVQRDLGLELTEWRSVVVPSRKEARWDGVAAHPPQAASQPEKAQVEFPVHANEPNGLEPPPLSLDPATLVAPPQTAQLPQPYADDWGFDYSLPQSEGQEQTGFEPPMVQSKRPAYRRDVSRYEIQSTISANATSAQPTPAAALPAQEAAVAPSEEPAAPNQADPAAEDEIGEPRIMTKRPTYRYSEPQDSEPQRSIAPSSWPKIDERRDRST